MKGQICAFICILSLDCAKCLEKVCHHVVNNMQFCSWACPSFAGGPTCVNPLPMNNGAETLSPLRVVSKQRVNYSSASCLLVYSVIYFLHSNTPTHDPLNMSPPSPPNPFLPTLPNTTGRPHRTY